LHSSEAAFLGDSNFPAYAVRNTTLGDKITLFKRLYKEYCRLGFSNYTDKPFAISGLEQRLTERFEDVSGAGVFGQHKGRCLLWTRAEDVDSLERIDFGDANPETHKPPSWSFMAHVGGIEYIDVPGRTVDWEIPGLQLTGTAAVSWLNADKRLVFMADARAFGTNRRSKLVYDVPSEQRGEDKCVIVGKSSEASVYVLIVRPAQVAKTGQGREVYRRAGAGYLPTECVKYNIEAVQIEII
jgi:hypothetical protein